MKSKLLQGVVCNILLRFYVLLPLLGEPEQKEGMHNKDKHAQAVQRMRDIAYPVGTEEDGPEEAAIDGGLVHHDGIFLVVAAIAGNGHDGVVPSRQLPVQQWTSNGV